MYYFHVCSYIFSSSLWARFPEAQHRQRFLIQSLFLSSPTHWFCLMLFCKLFVTADFPCLSPSILVDYIDFVSSARHVSCCFSQAMLAGGEVGERYVPWSWRCSALLVNLQEEKGGRTSFFWSRFFVLPCAFQKCGQLVMFMFITYVFQWSCCTGLLWNNIIFLCPSKC